MSSRRHFLQQLGLGTTALAGSHLAIPTHRTDFPIYSSLASFQDEQENYLLRISVQFLRMPTPPIKASLRSSTGDIQRAKSYFSPTEPPDVQSKRVRWQMAGLMAYPYVLVVWLKPNQEDADLILNAGQEHRFSLTELFEQSGLEYTTDQLSVSVGLLGSQEIGPLNTSLLGVPTDTKDFSFAVMADPQGGDPEDKSNGSLTRIKIHNAFVEDSVVLVELLENPAFCLVLGDIVDGQGQMPNFEKMVQYFRRADAPWLFSVGNHETKYKLNFGPKYDFTDFANFFAAQKSMNGSDKLLYSFDIGQWHFVVWPDPLRAGFWETHPHYFDWLEQDLEKNRDRPTFFLQHVPAHPIGINPLVSYVESVMVKRTLLNILAKHGNVRYVLSGHVHIPMIASLKTATEYRGMKFINLPAAGFRPRAFGEADLTGGPVQGIAVVQIAGDQAEVEFRTVTDEVYDYPEPFAEFLPDAYPLWLQHKWELPTAAGFTNGNFSEGLERWHRRYVYQEDENPSNRCEVRTLDGQPALYLFSRCRSFRTPGQDRLPQTINRLCQALAIAPQQRPELSFRYRVDETVVQPDTWAGAFVWVEGYERDQKKLSYVYAAGPAYGNLRDQHRSINPAATAFFDLGSQPDLSQVRLNVADDYEQAEGTRFADLRLDRLVINLGTWTANERLDQQFGVCFTDFAISPSASERSSVNGQTLATLPRERIWWKMIDHIAGEHIHVTEKYVPTRRS